MSSVLWCLPATAQIIPLGPKQTLEVPPEACLQVQPGLVARGDGTVLGFWSDVLGESQQIRQINPDGTLGASTSLFATQGYLKVASLPGGGFAALSHRDELRLTLLDESALPVTDVQLDDGAIFLDYAVAASDDGIAVVWQRVTSPGPAGDPILYVRRFGSDLSPRPGLAALDGDILRYPALTLLDDGRSIVAFNSAPDHLALPIQLQLVDAEGNAVGPPVSGPLGLEPQLAERNGLVALTWMSDTAPAGQKVGFQLWDPDTMTPVTLEQGVDDAAATGSPRVLETPEGWLVSWVWNESGGAAGVISARQLDPTGQPTHPSVELNEPVTMDHGSGARITHPSLELIGSRLVVAWQVYRFTPIIPTPCDVSLELEVQQFRLDLGTSLAEIPTLDWLGLALLSALLGTLACRRIG